MKNILTAFLIGFAIQPAIAQTKNLNSNSDSVLSFSEMVSLPGVTKHELYLRARDWLSNNCNILKIQDKEAGEISGTSSTEGNLTFQLLGTHHTTARFNFDICIWIKDGRYKYVIRNIENTAINDTDINAVFGRLYVSKHCPVKGTGLSPLKLDEAYQSAKDGFEKSENEIVTHLKNSLANPLNTDF